MSFEKQSGFCTFQSCIWVLSQNDGQQDPWSFPPKSIEDLAVTDLTSHSRLRNSVSIFKSKMGIPAVFFSVQPSHVVLRSPTAQSVAAPQDSAPKTVEKTHSREFGLPRGM